MADPAALKILHVVPYFPPDRHGGVGEVTRHLHQGLLAAGHDSEVVTAGQSRGEGRVHRFATTPWQFVSRGWRWLSQVESRDLVHFQNGDAIGLLAAMKARRCPVPAVLTLHVDGWKSGRANRPSGIAGGGRQGGPKVPARMRKAFFHAVCDRLALRLADEVVFICRSSAADFVGREKASAARVIYNGIPMERSAEDRREIVCTDLLFVGGSAPLKRAELLPAVLSRVRSRVPHAALRVVGLDPAGQAWLQARFQEQGLDAGVVFEGQCSHETVQSFYDSAGVLVVLSAHEGVPTVILEAMRAGVPSVATRVGGVGEAVEEGVNGFLTDVDDLEQVADKAATILEDPELRDRMSLNARQMQANKFSQRRMVSDYQSVYREVLARRRRSASP